MQSTKQPEISAEQVHEKIREKLNGEPFTYESIHQVVSERLRVYPRSIPLIDPFIDDYKIPETDIVDQKGSVIFVALNGLHKDPDYHADPMITIQRDLAKSQRIMSKSVPTWPFGDGPHIFISNDYSRH